MRLIAFSLIAGLLVLGTCSSASAFGRGGGAPPHGGGGGGHAGGGGSHGAASGPFGGVHNYSPPHEASIPRGGDERGVTTRPFGGTIIRPEGGVRPEGAIGEGSRGAIGGDRGTGIAAGGYRGGVGIGAGGVAGGGGQLGHSTSYMRASTLGGIGRGIRGGEYPYFTRGWYGNHGGAWFPGLWFGGVDPWFNPPWDTLSPFVGIAGPPIDYDYGSTAVIQDGSMYLNGESIGSADDYAAQAVALDDTGRAAMLAPTDEWQPLGVFGLIQGNEAVAQRIFQLAANRAGIVHGNYYDAVADVNQPVFGAIDRKTQRVAWSIGDRKDIVYEAGLNNLTQNETTVLIHYGKVRTQQMILVRLPPPPGQPGQPGQPAPPALPAPPGK